MDALVIGASGLLGQALLRQLIGEGQYPAATVLPRERLGIDGCEVRELDFMNKNALYRLLSEERPPYIYYLGGQGSAALSRKDPEQTAEQNILGTLRFLEIVHSIEDYYPRILLSSTAEEYGTVRGREEPLTEDSTLRPDSVFGVTKACQTMLGSVYARTYGMGIVTARTFSCIGPGLSPEHLIADLVMKVAEIEAGFRTPVLHVRNTALRRDHIDVRDAARAYQLIAEKGFAGEVYNVAGGKAVSVLEIVELLRSLSRETFILETEDTGAGTAVAGDITKLRKDTGYAPEYSLEETLHTMLDRCRRSFGME
ncbi:MAG: GDP-mannose 4,6-dehydratase [Oscillospiraceae bacterium]|nr:GDP-mannose 4,6-dehydratase [Oscillospiraceae bacterium]